MIRWSPLENIESLTLQLNPYLFPLLNQYQIRLIDRQESSFSKDLYQSLVSGIRDPQLKEKMIYQNQALDSKDSFLIHIEPINPADFKERCQQKEAKACLGLRAQKKFNSKIRDQTKIWVNMFRLDQTSAALFYFLPE